MKSEIVNLAKERMSESKKVEEMELNMWDAYIHSIDERGEMNGGLDEQLIDERIKAMDELPCFPMLRVYLCD